MLKRFGNSVIGDHFIFGQRFAAAIPLCAKLCINKLGDGLRPNFVQTPVIKLCFIMVKEMEVIYGRIYRRN